MNQDEVPSKFNDYMQNGFDTIEGWPGSKQSVVFMAAFKELFGVHDEKGGVCEIGVHHGKYIIALHNMLLPRRSLAIDIFEDQTKNFDGSGCGSTEILKKNIEAFAYNPSSIDFLAKDSLDIRQSDIDTIIERSGYFAIFSIDGGHTALHTSYDFFTASKLTSPYGIIAVDDLFHPDWPTVTEGLYRAISSKRSPFVPLFITRKKAFFCHVSVFKEYQPFVIDAYSAFARREARVVDFFGWNVPSLYLGSEY